MIKIETFTYWLPERRWVWAWTGWMGFALIASWLQLFSTDRALHLMQLFVLFWFGMPVLYGLFLPSSARREFFALARIHRYCRAVLKASLYLGCLFYFIDRTGTPTDTNLLQWLGSLDLYAGMIYVAWCLYCTVSGAIKASRSVMYEWLLTTLGFGWAWVCLRWVLVCVIPAAQQLYHREPQQFYAYCGIALMSFALMRLTRQVRQKLLDGAGLAKQDGGMGVAITERPLLSKMDKKRIASHEAGHALLWAAVTPCPEQLSIHCFAMRNGVGGLVRGPAFPHHFPPVQVETFRMLLDLAGKEAEWVLLNEISFGDAESAESDEAKWQARAKSYLSQQAEQIFYIDPQSPAEATFNAQALKALRVQHQALLREFMSLNRGLLLRMVAELEQHGRMEVMRVKHYLSEVVLPDDFPRVSL